MSSGIHTKEYGYVNRQSMRLKDYDYSRPGAYFVTISVQNKECLFGKIENKKMVLNEYGEIVKNTWYNLVNHVHGINLDEFIIMPNHVHGIIFIVGAGSKPAPIYVKPVHTYTKPAPYQKTSVLVDSITALTCPAAITCAESDPATNTKQYALPEIVRQFKTFSARRVNQLRQTPGIPVWQRNYYDHIVCNEKELNNIRQYIIDNPENWGSDDNYTG